MGGCNISLVYSPETQYILKGIYWSKVSIPGIYCIHPWYKLFIPCLSTFQAALGSGCGQELLFLSDWPMSIYVLLCDWSMSIYDLLCDWSMSIYVLLCDWSMSIYALHHPNAPCIIHTLPGMAFFPPVSARENSHIGEKMCLDMG